MPGKQGRAQDSWMVSRVRRPYFAKDAWIRTNNPPLCSMTHSPGSRNGDIIGPPTIVVGVR